MAGRGEAQAGEYFVEQKDREDGKGEASQADSSTTWSSPRPRLDCDTSRPSDEPWLELWQTMLWAIPRGGNNVRSRAPFNRRRRRSALRRRGRRPGTQLVDFRSCSSKSQFKTEPISGALMLGAQAVNAEAVPFAGRVDHNLLLHFWQVVVLTFVPQVVNKKDAKVERVGYVLAIPDVADLGEFRHASRRSSAASPPKDPASCPRPARIDLPAQANLEVLRRLKGGQRRPGRIERRTRASRSASDSLAGAGTGSTAESQALADRQGAARGWGGSIRAVESYHMLKHGNNIKLLSFARVADRPGLVGDYERIARRSATRCSGPR